MKDYEMSAAALYDGGWRSSDRKELQDFYGLTAKETDGIVKRLQEFEQDIRPGFYQTRYQAKKQIRGNEVVVKVCGGYVIMDCADYNVWKKQR